MQVENSPTVEASLNALGTRVRAELDADRLLAFVLNCTLSSLRAYPERTLSADQWRRWQDLLKRRASGEPFAYLVGTQEFWSLTLEVGTGVLVPRADSETLIEAALARIDCDDGGWVIDVGTGSGNLALALASERSNLTVLAIDISADALYWASRNIARHGAGRVLLSQGRGLDAIADGSLRALISNPPYIAAGDPDLHPDAAQFEPECALIAQDQGMAILRQLAAEGSRVLLPGGWLLLEHGWKQGSAVLSLLQDLGYGDCETIADLAGRPRVTVGRI